MNVLSSHRLMFEIPSTRDYLNGGFGDLVAQCSCDSYEYVYSRREGAYWHSLHRERPAARPQLLLIDSPMPNGWEEVAAPIAVAPSRDVGPRVWACLACIGVGTVSAFGPQGGHFYHFGERAVCTECDGSGVTGVWAA